MPSVITSAVSAHAIFDVVVDEVVEFFVGEAPISFWVLGKDAIDFMIDGF
ncbi:hypothetical protein OOK60_06935 [Trichothermofontia sichuanensis B231]|nr:hypothetical protein [Trichothermofontia sichuanensis]UZQ55798.1 hypothetical protein OOK60_06935 [Trichothermofontia sichuanensis B231]